VIQASVHVRLSGGVLSNSSPQPLTCVLSRLVAISCLTEEALHRTVLSLQRFGTTHSILHIVVSVSFHASCLKL
jgi:hypothetical protein